MDAFSTVLSSAEDQTPPLVADLSAGLVGPWATHLLHGGIQSTVIDTPNELPADHAFDFLVIDVSLPGIESDDVIRCVEAAHELGTKVVVVSADRPPTWEASTEVTVGVGGVGGDLSMLPSVDLRRINPVGYRRISGDEAVGLRGLLASSDEQVETGPDSWWTVDAFVDFISSMRDVAGVLDDTGGDLSAWNHAELLINLSAAGVPTIVGDLDSRVTELMSDDLTEALLSVTADALGEPELRDHTSIDLRRTAMREHSRRRRWCELAEALAMQTRCRPLVSVVLATNRPHRARRAVELVAEQSYPDLEFVLALHGEGFDDRLAAWAMRRTPFPTRVVRVDAAVPYGGVLTLAALAAKGDLIAKMDDDDWYGRDHIWDLVLAAEYSGAALVGKAAEFVYLAGSDLTIRRMADGAHRFDTSNIASGALLFDRAAGRDVGFWRPIGIKEDRYFITDMLAEGRTFRTHGHGYVLNRHVDTHAWDVPDSYFTAQADLTTIGLDLEWAMV